MVSFLIVAVIIGLIVGVALGNSDVLNFITRSAEAHIKEMKAQIQAERDKIDTKYYEDLQKAHTEAEKEKLRLEVEAKRRELEQKLAQQQAWAEMELAFARLVRMASLIVGSVAVLILSGGGAISAILVAYSRLVQAQATQFDPWRIPAFRASAIQQARANEMTERESLLSRQFTRPLIGGNGKHPPREPVTVTGRRTA